MVNLFLYKSHFVVAGMILKDYLKYLKKIETLFYLQPIIMLNIIFNVILI